ncbi:hypothetical protein O6H91_01G030800 [Diphasiastrum complanatum]|uniref:Uncharacterized protein n=2 Tax=Diphasiastrum complanatum TaxID=34168 RepID=A0ACC2EPH1_DIPCM|nr:hypothetical protein O6H91_01G030800 [Diphasiastrum complanatum]KAJ7568390.1 hypothetical protein O6H91_01G030800 [Diphasiastrum complanatum]
MPPKKASKKGKKRKKKGPQEPKHDPGWDKTIQNGKWERPLEALPDPSQWPAFGEIREKVLMACRLISIIWSISLHDNFIMELFGVPRVNLVKLELRGTKYLTKFIMSPLSVCPLLQSLDLSCCPILEYIFVQSSSLKILSLARCISLKKAFLQARNLKVLNFHECRSLTFLMLWSDTLTELDLCCKEMTMFQLCCPSLVNFQRPLVKAEKLCIPSYPTIERILRVDRHVAEEALKEKPKAYHLHASSLYLPHTYHMGF